MPRCGRPHPSHSIPTSVTIAIRPLGGTERAEDKGDLGREANYLCFSELLDEFPEVAGDLGDGQRLGSSCPVGYAYDRSSSFIALLLVWSDPLLHRSAPAAENRVSSTRKLFLGRQATRNRYITFSKIYFARNQTHFASRSDMREIKAFVGHSFTEGDADVIRKFTDYFDSVARSHPQFSWESAENAEPRILTDKVLRLIQDKNTFIGICTRKEQIAPANQLRPLIGQRASWKINKTDLIWKTSDWIIQEIGLAIGRRLNVILLIEEGVRDPGGLQGDIEYIPFNRTAPERSYGKILEMLSAISPPIASNLPATMADTKSVEPAPPDAVPVERSGMVPAKPDASWTKETYERAAFKAILNGNDAYLSDLTGSYKGTADGSLREKASAWDAFVEYVRFSTGKGGKLQRLKEIAEGCPTSATLGYLAQAYAVYDQHNLSAETLVRAHALAKDVKHKARSLRLAIEQFALGGQPKKSYEMLNALRSLAAENPEIEVQVLQALANLAKREEDKATELVVLERLLELDPDNSKLRFDIAYKYGEQEKNDLSIYHYEMIPADERTPGAWNNIGATLDQLGLPAKSVEAYKLAADRGETLAMSNLGYKLMRAGFIDLALLEHKRAIALENPHKNVGQMFSALQSVPEQEEKRQTHLIEGAKKRVVFLQKLGAATVLTEMASVGGSWQGPECVLTGSLTDGTINFEGFFERANPFGMGIFGAIGGPSKTETNVRHKIVYSGKARGRAVFGEITSGRDGAASDLGLNTSAAYMFFGDDGTEVFIMIDPDSDKPSYQRLKKIKPAKSFGKDPSEQA